MRRTFILHANGAKLPTDLLGLTCVRYDPELTPQELKTVNQKVRKAIEAEGRLASIEGLWWQYSLTARSDDEPSAISLLRISRDRNGGLEVTAVHGRRTAPSRRATGARRRRSGPTRPGSSTSGTANARGTRTRPGSRGPARSSSSPRTAPVATGRPARNGPASCTPGRPGSTCAPTPRDWAVLDSGSIDGARDPDRRASCATGRPTPTARAASASRSASAFRLRNWRRIITRSPQASA